MSVRRVILFAFSITIGTLPGDRGVLANELTKSAPGDSDCGTVSLYYLLGVAGHPTPIEEIRAISPRRDERGYSLRELTEGARQLGLDVTGVRSRDTRLPPDRPMIVLLKREDHGHYAVIRPVGHTGTLVQILDGREQPDVLDMATFAEAYAWTGIGLIPDRGRAYFHAGLVLAVVAMTAWVLLALRSHRRSRP